MSRLRLELAEDRRAFRPSEVLAGSAVWNLEQPPQSLELRLLWSTRGRGIVDSQVVQRLTIESPPAEGRHEFRFTLPDSPWSFAGQLVSLQWSLIFVAAPTGQQAQVNLVVSPAREEIRLASA